MNHAGTLRCFPSLMIRPGLHFHLSGGDEGLKIEKGIRLFDESVNTTLLKSELLQEHLFVLVGLQRSNILLGLCRYHHCLSTFLTCYFLNLTAVFVALLCRCLIHIADVEHRFRGKQEEVVSHLLLFLALKGHRTGVLTLLQHLLISLQNGHRHLSILVASGGSFLRLSQLSLYRFEVFQLQLGVYYLLVLNGIYGRSALTHHVVVIETAQHMYYSVGLTDVSKELVSQSFTLRCTLYESCNVNNLACCRHYSSGVNYLCELCQTLVRHGYHTYIRLNCAKREIRCLCLSTRQTVK